MSGDPPKDSNENAEIDKIASEACTRSGAFALLVALTLFLLCVSWQNRKLDQALGSYLAARLNLAMNLEELKKDAVWQKYLEEHSDGEEKPLAQLIDATVWIVDSQAETKWIPNKSATPQSPQAPLPPGQPSVVIKSQHQLPEISNLVQSWRLLNDADGLAKL